MSPVEEDGECEDKIQSTLSLQQSISSCISRKAKAESRGNRLLHFWIAVPDKLIYPLRQGWAAMCHRGLRVYRFHSNRRLRWRISLISSLSVADSVLISDISCYIGVDCNDNLETHRLPFACDRPNPAPESRWHTGLMLDSIISSWSCLIFCFYILLQYCCSSQQTLACWCLSWNTRG